MTTIATFSKPEEAHLLRMHLGASGITAFVQDEHIVQMYWLYSNAIGGVRVQVADADLELAREVLSTNAKLPDIESSEVVCPKCGSQQTAPDEVPRRIAFLSFLLLNFPLLIGWHRWRCATCNHVFNVSTGPPNQAGERIG